MTAFRKGDKVTMEAEVLDIHESTGPSSAVSVRLHFGAGMTKDLCAIPSGGLTLVGRRCLHVGDPVCRSGMVGRPDRVIFHIVAIDGGDAWIRTLDGSNSIASLTNLRFDA